MARRAKHEEHENHERWLVSYADFITLLFAFFVVMYSVSSVNEGKMRVLSDSLVATFNNRNKSLAPIQIGALARSPYSDKKDIRTSPTPFKVMHPLGPQASNGPGHGHGPLAAGVRDGGAPVPGAHAGAAAGASVAGKKAGQGGAGGEKKGEKKGEVAPGSGQGVGASPASEAAVVARVRAGLAALLGRHVVTMRVGMQGVELELNNNFLFASGAARVAPGAVQVLGAIARVLKSFPNRLEVEGFTDDVPISTVAFPSNWELSAGRAASVVHLFMQEGVRPQRMVALGFGQYHPVASNSTAAGRAKNRRVVIVITTGSVPPQHVPLTVLGAVLSGEVGGGTPRTGPQ